jgi:glutaredoxin 3
MKQNTAVNSTYITGSKSQPNELNTRRLIMDGNSASAGSGTHDAAFPEVTIYTSSDCRWCGVVKDHLTSLGVAYTEKNVEQDEAAAIEAFNFAGRRQTPVTVIGSQAVVGYQRAEIDALLGVTTPGSMDEGMPS